MMRWVKKPGNNPELCLNRELLLYQSKAKILSKKYKTGGNIPYIKPMQITLISYSALGAFLTKKASR
jgi:hypothetical protein